MINQIKKLSDTFAKVLESCPEITYIGDGVLRTKVKDVTLEEGIILGNKLKEILKRYRGITGYGRGLAAPQIGEGGAVFVTFVDDDFKVYINPKIVSHSKGLNLFRESCLSRGYLSVDVKRPVSIEIKYVNENGDIKSEKADGFLARLLQHEYDHMEGIINIDKAEPASIEFMSDDPLKAKLRDVK